MSSEDTPTPSSEEAKTARIVGQLVKYSREVNQSETVGEVSTYALEATFHVMEGNPSPTVVEVRPDGLEVLESMSPHVEPGDDPTALEATAYRTGETVILPGEGVSVDCAGDRAVVSAADLGIDPPDAALTVAVPSVYGDGMGDTGVVVCVRWDSIGAVAEHHVRPLEYLADHVATAVNNIRSRERLERARNDLATRKEMIEMYDSLLRHDLSNDLQVITGFSNAIAESVDDDQNTEYADRIHRTARSAADLVERVGDLVETLEEAVEPERTALRPILEATVEDSEAKYGSLTVDFDPETVEYQIYAGDLLDSVFTNVLSNAAVHNDGPVEVRVYTAEPTPETVVVGFADDGAGIPAEIRDDILRMGKKGPDSDGTGLGLGFVRALTESYGGRVAVGESDRGGADIRITFRRV
jgi:signal transduction histidine kinase